MDGRIDVTVRDEVDGVYPAGILVENVFDDSVDTKDDDDDDDGVDLQGVCVGFGLIVELPSEENLCSIDTHCHVIIKFREIKLCDVLSDEEVRISK